MAESIHELHAEAARLHFLRLHTPLWQWAKRRELAQRRDAKLEAIRTLTGVTTSKR